MHSPHATWETSLVIPETVKTVDQQTLDALLRIEELLTQLLGQRIMLDPPASLDKGPLEDAEPKPKQRKTK